MSKWRTGLCVLMIPLFLTGPVWAQSTAREASPTSGRRGVATVIFCGLGGAVIGLSTLSFYGHPQDHTGNIYTGLALGLAAGLTYVLSENESPRYAQSAPENKKAPFPELSQFEDSKSVALASRSVGEVPIAALRFSF